MLNHHSSSWYACALGGVLSAGAAGALGQSCEPHWLPGAGVSGVNGVVRASTSWDPDGDGPQTPRVVVGGEFTLAGSTPVSNIAAYDPATGAWSALGQGVNGVVFALCASEDGSLVVGGSFTQAGGAPASRIARWNGAAWSTVGSGVSGGGGVDCLLALPGGDIVAGGAFSHAGGTLVNNIARWNGLAWVGLGTGTSGGVTSTVLSLARLPNGDVVAGGWFTSAGGQPAAHIARWDGAAWHNMDLGFPVDRIQAMAVWDSDGPGPLPAQLVAGRQNIIYVWNGTTWSLLNTEALNGVANALTAGPNGELFVGGDFQRGQGLRYIARCEGDIWVSLGSGMDAPVNTMTLMADGRLFAGGEFKLAGDVGAAQGALWDGAAWAAMGTGLNGRIRSLAPTADGGVLAAGEFTTSGDGSQSRSVAKWDGATWSPIGDSRPDLDTEALVVLEHSKSGDVIVGGSFHAIGGVPANRIARWDGTAWSALGSGMSYGGLSDGFVMALAELPSGDVIAAGQFVGAGGLQAIGVARWDGESWHAMGRLAVLVRDIAVTKAGEVFAVGSFQGSTAEQRVRRWDGKAWVALGSGVGSQPNDHVDTVAALPDGGVVVGGGFNVAGGHSAINIARWDGSQWHALGQGLLGAVRDVTVLEDGSIVAVGTFNTAGGQPARGVARWDGSAWSPYGSGVVRVGDGLQAVAVLAGDDIAVGGDFAIAGDHVSAYFARWSNAGHPQVAADPADITVNVGETLIFSATPEAGFEGVSVQWTRNGIAISDGAGGASPGGGFVTGATALLASPTDGTAATLIVEQTRAGDAGAYAAIFSNECGEAASAAAVAIVDIGACATDFDGDGTVNSTDVSAFINQWFADQAKGTLVTDWNEDGIVNSADVTDFINSWFEDTLAGCGG